MEIWKEIPLYRGYYSASNLGRIRRNGGTPNRKTDRILKPMQNTRGYFIVAPSVPWQKQTGRVVHRLVIEAFGPNQPTPSHEVNHINGDKTDNRIENLEWVTRSENQLHAYANNLNHTPHGSQSHSSKLTEDDVIQILDLIANRVYRKDIAARFSISPKMISEIVSGAHWRHVPRPANLTNRRKGRHILTETDVREIKALIAEDCFSHREIGEMYGVSGPTIWHISDGRTWKHV